MRSSVPLKIPANKFILNSMDIATIMGVAPRTVAKWIDAERMHGTRKRGTLIRLVALPHFIEFLRTYNYEFTQEEA